MKALNETENGVVKSAAHKKLIGDSNIQAVSAQDIVNFHKQLTERRGTLDSIPGPAPIKLYQGGHGASEGTAKVATPLKLRTASIQLPDVMK